MARHATEKQTWELETCGLKSVPPWKVVPQADRTLGGLRVDNHLEAAGPLPGLVVFVIATHTDQTKERTQ